MSKNIEAMIAELDGIDNDINKLTQSIKGELDILSEHKMRVKARLDEAITKEARKMLKDKDYGCGTAHIDTDLFDIKAVVSKKVKWDEKELRKTANKIRAAGQDPEVYIKYKLSVTETAFKGFTDDIKAEFEPARTVEPSAPKITITRKD